MRTLLLTLVFVNRRGSAFFVTKASSFAPRVQCGAKKTSPRISRDCSIDADLRCDTVAHRREAACVPKKGRAPARHTLPILCGRRSEALPFAVFSSLARLTGIGGATHASRGTHTPGGRAFAPLAATTRRVANFVGRRRQIRETIAQVRARTLRRGWRRCWGRRCLAAVDARRSTRRFVDEANRSRFAVRAPEHGKQGRKRPTKGHRDHVDTIVESKEQIAQGGGG
jgi:hypothetical protein